VAVGTPEEICESGASHTGRVLSEKLGPVRKRRIA